MNTPLETASRIPNQELHRFVWYIDGNYRQGPLLATLIEKSRGAFDGPIQSLPLPAEAPSAIPRIVLQNQAGNFVLQSSPERISVERSYSGVVPINQMADDIQFASGLFQTVKEIMAGRISRVAYHRLRAYESDSGAMKLVKYFCLPELISRDRNPPGPLSRCENFELHAHKIYELQRGTKVNSWVRCKTGISTADSAPVMVVEQDLNTMAEEATSRDFLTVDAENLLRSMCDEASKIFELYFPRGVSQ
jgi:hypothetical protein